MCDFGTEYVLSISVSLTPKLGRNAPAKTPDDPYGWVPDTVSGILEKQEYLGHTVNFKTHPAERLSEGKRKEK